MRKVFLAVVGVAAGMMVAQAAVSAVPAVECRNCTTPAHEEAVALGLPGTGIRFVYNFRNHTLRKFRVYFDNDLPSNFVTDAVPVDPQPTDGARVETPAGTAVRTLYEMNVDPGVLGIFRTMDAFNATYANAWSKQYRIDIGRLGLTNGDTGPVHFDPQRIGWDFPGGEGLRFVDRVADLLNGANSSAQLDARLSELIHGIIKPSTGVYVEGSGSAGGPGATLGVQFGNIGSEFTIDFCSSDGSCARVRISVTPNGVRSEFLGARDAFDVPFPARSERPVHRDWSRAGLENARSMARFIASRTNGQWAMQGGMNCTRVVLACVETGTHYVCTIHCP